MVRTYSWLTGAVDTWAGRVPGRHAGQAFVRPVTRYIAAAGHTSMTIWPRSGSQGGSLLRHRSSSGRLSCAGVPCQPTSNAFLLVLASLIRYAMRASPRGALMEDLDQGA